MKKRIVFIITMIVAFPLLGLSGCGQNKTHDENEKVDDTPFMEKELERYHSYFEDTQTDEEWAFVSGTSYHNGIAIAVQRNQMDEKRVVALDDSGEMLFVFPNETEVESQLYFTEETDFFSGTVQGFDKGEYIDKEGEYIWNGNISLNREGEILYDISDKYHGSLLGNGYMLVEEIPSGYETVATKMGVIDGYGNEIIPVTTEFAEVCGEELPSNQTVQIKDGVAFFEKTRMIVDANLGVYYPNRGSIVDYRDGNLLVHGGTLYKNQGNLTVEYEQKYNIILCLTEEHVVSLTYEDNNSEGVLIKTFDLDGNLLSEKSISNIKLDSDEFDFDNGYSALYIAGSDGAYVTVIDEYGNFQFEPIKHSNEISEWMNKRYGSISEGFLRVAVDESETIFVNIKGEEVLSIPYNIDFIGNCSNGKVVVNTGDRCFYVDIRTGEYIEG